MSECVPGRQVVEPIESIHTIQIWEFKIFVRKFERLLLTCQIIGLLAQLVLGILTIYLDIPAAFSVISRILAFMFELLAACGSFYWREYIRSELNKTST